MPNNSKVKPLPRKQLTGSLGDMLTDNSIDSVIKLILKLNLAIVNNSEADIKIKNYIPFDK
tara:strand:+ start:647 stop:829 length:183 start_codon:yes stop_codon:yes gene_type:complete